MRVIFAIIVAVLVATVSAQNKPYFPPAGGNYLVNVTYSPAFFEKSEIDSAGFMRANSPKGKYVVYGHDDLRTSETALWRFDQNKAYTVQKFVCISFHTRKMSTLT